MSLTRETGASVNSLPTPPYSAGSADSAEERIDRFRAMHHRLSFDRAADPMLIIAPERSLADANRQALALLGYTRDDALLLHGADVFASAPPWAQVQRDGYWQGLTEIRAQDGSLTLVEARAETPMGAAGGFIVTLLHEHGPVQHDERLRARLVTIVAAPDDPLAAPPLDSPRTGWDLPGERPAGYGGATDVHRPLDPPGDFVVGSTIVRDVAPSPAAVAPPAASEALFEAAFADAPIGMAVVQPDGRLLQVNRAIREMLGYTEDELLTMTFAELTHPHDLQSSLAILDRFIAGEIESHTFEKRDIRKDGQVLWTLLSISTTRDETGAPRYFVAQMQDITERKAAEAELQATHQDRRQILQHITDGFVALDRDWRFTYLNPAAETMFGRGRSELIGVSFWQAFPLLIETPLHAALHRAMAEGISADVDLHLSPHDRWFDVRAYASPNGVVVYFRDVSAGKQLERDLRGALASAHAANRSSSEFLAMMSHELRTPMQAVLGYADLLLAGPPGSLSGEQAEDVRCIQQGAKRIIALVDQMLDLSRLQAGRLEFKVHPIDLTEVVEQVRQDVAPQAAAKSLELSIDIPDSLPRVRADATRLRQILLNLIGNAVKFTDKGWVRISARESDAGIEIAVQDTGIGIPEQALGHIFEEFRQADSLTTRRYGGAGLGLAIARNLAEQQGGAISVKSAPKAGSTFTLTMPAARARRTG